VLAGKRGFAFPPGRSECHFRRGPIPLTEYSSEAIVGHGLRTLYAFDPGRCAILLIGGDKTGDDRWYEMNVPIADRLYDEHLEQLRREGLKHG
jgi:hypothetical protein